MDNLTLAAVNKTDCRDVQIPIEIFFAIAVVSLAENLLVVVAIIQNKNLHSPMYCFICNLALFNMICSIFKTWECVMLVFASTGHLNSTGEFELKLDDIMDSLICMSFIGSICSLLAIAIDRYITIFHALRYHNIMTMKRVAIILGGIWSFCAGSSVVMILFFHAPVIMTLLIVLFLVSLILILFLYVHMFLLARTHTRKIASLAGNTVHQKINMKGVITLTILFGVFIACWSPFFFHILLKMVCQSNPYCECYRSLFEVHVFLLMCNAVIDPVIYAFRSAELRSTFRKMLFCSHSRPCHY